MHRTSDDDDYLVILRNYIDENNQSLIDMPVWRQHYLFGGKSDMIKKTGSASGNGIERDMSMHLHICVSRCRRWGNTPFRGKCP
jgi:hypothetical protein